LKLKKKILKDIWTTPFQVTILRKIRGNSQESFLGIRGNSQESCTGKSGENVEIKKKKKTEKKFSKFYMRTIIEENLRDTYWRKTELENYVMKSWEFLRNFRINVTEKFLETS